MVALDRFYCTLKLNLLGLDLAIFGSIVSA